MSGTIAAVSSPRVDCAYQRSGVLRKFRPEISQDGFLSEELLFRDGFLFVPTMIRSMAHGRARSVDLFPAKYRIPLKTFIALKLAPPMRVRMVQPGLCSARMAVLARWWWFQSVTSSAPGSFSPCPISTRTWFQPTARFSPELGSARESLPQRTFRARALFQLIIQVSNKMDRISANEAREMSEFSMNMRSRLRTAP